MSERTTTIVSALTALAILGLGVTAQPTADQANGRIESLESDLRFQIEMSWRHDGRTQAARAAQLADAVAAWKASPQTAADRLLLERWLREAIVSTLPGESGAFPPVPTFSENEVEGDESSPASDASPAAPPDQSSQTKPEAAPRPAANGGMSAPAVKPAEPRDVRLKPGQAYTPPRAKEFHITPRLPDGGQAATPPANVPPAEPKRVMAAKPAEAPPTPRDRAPAIIDERVERSVTPALTPAPAEPRMSSPTPPAIAARPLPPVRKDQESPAAPPTPAASSAAAARSKPAASPTEAERPINPVMVNLAELNAQIGGYHAGLQEIEARVVARRGKLTEGEVARLVGQLEQLAGQYQFVRLYFDGLSPRERRFVKTPRPMSDAIALVEGERAALAAEELDFLTALEETAEDDELARRLRAMAAEVGADSPPVEQD
jgi:hypothetical protein